MKSYVVSARPSLPNSIRSQLPRAQSHVIHSLIRPNLSRSSIRLFDPTRSLYLRSVRGSEQLGAPDDSPAHAPETRDYL